MVATATGRVRENGLERVCLLQHSGNSCDCKSITLPEGSRIDNHAYSFFS